MIGLVEHLTQGRSRRTQDSFFGLANPNAGRQLVVIGELWDATSSYRRGAAAGPDAIRAATSAKLYNNFTDQGLDLSTLWKVCDHGNIRPKSARRFKASLISRITSHAHPNRSLLFLGGDHFVTYPSFIATAELQKRPLSLLYFDAHPDLYVEYEGRALSHATVVSRILDESSFSTGVVCYVGIRASTPEQNERIKSLRLTSHTTRDVYSMGTDVVASSLRSLLRGQPVYVSIDLDCLDPAFAPGVGNPQPGGLTTRQLIEILQEIEGVDVVAADIVEYCPRFDSASRLTGFTAAILIKELMGTMAKAPVS